MPPPAYSGAERFWLWALSAVGVVVVNGLFLYGALAEPALLRATLRNPVGAALMLEAFLLMGALAYLLTRWRVSRLHWGWFVALSLAGSIAFALPVVLLWPGRATGGGTS